MDLCYYFEAARRAGFPVRFVEGFSYGEVGCLLEELTAQCLILYVTEQNLSRVLTLSVRKEKGMRFMGVGPIFLYPSKCWDQYFDAYLSSFDIHKFLRVLSGLLGSSFRDRDFTEIARTTFSRGFYLENPGFIQNISKLGLRFSLGCCHKCGYCHLPAYYGRLQKRRLEDIKAELLYIQSVLGDSHCTIEIKDEDLLSDPLYAKDLLDALKNCQFSDSIIFSCQFRVENINSNLIHAIAMTTIQEVSVGLETADQQQLKQLDKPKGDDFLEKIQEYLSYRKEYPSITFGLNIILGLPNTTSESLLKTVRIINRHRVKNLAINYLSIFPHTALYNNSSKKVAHPCIQKGFIDIDYGLLKEHFFSKLRVENSFLNKYFFQRTLLLYKYLTRRDNPFLCTFLQESEEGIPLPIGKNTLYYRKNKASVSVVDHPYYGLNKYSIKLLRYRPLIYIDNIFNIFQGEVVGRHMLVVIKLKKPFLIFTASSTQRLDFLKQTLLCVASKTRRGFTLLSYDFKKMVMRSHL